MAITDNYMLINELAQKLHAGYLNTIRTGELSKDHIEAPWDDLPPEVQRENRATVRMYAFRLNALGYEIDSMDSPAALQASARLDSAPEVELISELGHLSWMNRKLAAGWEYSPVSRGTGERLHPSLVPWSSLPELDRDKERQIVRAMPELLASAGYHIVEVAPQAQSKTATGFGLNAMLLEELAQALHQSYISHEIDNHASVFHNAALRPWDRLDDAWKTANRDVARILQVQLASAGYALGHGDGAGIAVPPEAWAHAVAPLAQLAHRQWVRERLQDGWTFAEGPKDLTAKTHPDLRPWQELSAEAQAKTRHQLEQIPAILISSGLRVILFQESPANGG